MTAAQPAIYALHGFLGAPADWARLQDSLEQLATPPLHFATGTLTGHDITEPEPDEQAFAFDRQTARILNELAATPSGIENSVLLGYSMGARVALATAIQSQAAPRGLALISGTAGLQDERLRDERRQADRELATLALESGTAAFVQAWQQRPLIRSQQARMETQAFAEMLKRRQQLSAQAIARTLTMAGTGSMGNLWPLLNQVTCPVLIIGGAADQKFVEIGAAMAAQIDLARQVVIPNCGHAPQLENPAAVAGPLAAWLNEL